MIAKITRFLAVAAALALLGGVARADVLDRIEIGPEAAGETEVIIWLARDVAYRSSSPRDAGRVIRIYFQPLDGGLTSTSGIKEVLNGAAQGSVPRFSVAFPDFDNTLSVSFADTVTFRVLQSGSRRISIFVRSAAPR
jgi:hypothetical protein